MTIADPYVVRLPEKITNQDGSPSLEFLAWLNYDNRWKHDVFQQLGGGVDLVSDGDSAFGRLLSLEAQVTSILDIIEDNPLTSDTDSLTVDADVYTVDMTKA